MASAEDASVQLKYQTWVLKVSIHCQGCRTAVKKTLQNLDGVYKTTIDAQQHKVTVTGNVDAEALIKRLAKIGKPAELWTEKKPSGNTNPNATSGATSTKDKKNKASAEASDSPGKQSGSETTAHKPADTTAGTNGEASKKSSKESQKSNAKNSDGSAGQPEKAANDGGKKKGKNGNAGSSGEGGAAPEEAGKGGNGVGASQLPQPPPAYDYPVYPAPPPVYVMSYNTMHPTACYGGAYYPMPVPQSGYVYSGHPPLPLYNYSAPPTASQATYELFNDDNAAGCVVM